ncbi:MAG TPA: PIN domain-containing protein [Ramlibacter sp.]|uniref:PIN domain-containing protein n=1 Tax=Ramlibacter sp. TaxID=1917967 RepID=UPI002B9941CC|nr:PIN domain-containing protein [Ramlibacter sp.]HVZ46171.1 PIN domain-containing protein [Ramlibacter sp.]
MLDTNVVLDLFVFEDPAAAGLRLALDAGACDWIATDAMRDELEHVIRYPNLARRADAEAVLARFDGGARIVGVPLPANIQCTDADDQKFIDLALAHRAVLLSKDKAVLKLRRRLAKSGVQLDGVSYPKNALDACAVSIGNSSGMK